MATIAVTLDQARDRFRRAHAAAKAADKVTAALYDRFAAKTLMAVKGQPVERSAAMLVRMAIAFEVLVDRRRWPDRVAGLPASRRRAGGAPVIIS